MFLSVFPSEFGLHGCCVDDPPKEKGGAKWRVIKNLNLAKSDFYPYTTDGTTVVDDDKIPPRHYSINSEHLQPRSIFPQTIEIAFLKDEKALNFVLYYFTRGFSSD